MSVAMPADLADALARIREISQRFGGSQALPSVTAGSSAFAQTLSAALGTASDTSADTPGDASSTLAALSSVLGSGTSGNGTSSVSSAVQALLGATAGVSGATGTSGAATSGAALGEQAVQLATTYSGTPYLWGGTDPAKGLDCSGLTRLVFGRLGIALPRTSAEQSKVGVPVTSLAQARPGDLLFFGSPVHHVGIYAGDGKMVDAPHKGATVGLHPVWSSVSGIRRVTPATAAQVSQTGSQLGAVAAALPALSQLGALSALDATSDGSSDGSFGSSSGSTGSAASYASLVRFPSASAGSVDDLLSSLAGRTPTGSLAGAGSPGARSGTLDDPAGVVSSRAVPGPGATLPGGRTGTVRQGPGGATPVSSDASGGGPVTGSAQGTTTVNALLAAERGFGYGAPGGIMGSAGEHAVTLPAGPAAAGTSAASVGTASLAGAARLATVRSEGVTATSGAGWRTAPYADLFAAAGAKYGVDPALLSAIAKAESGYRSSATSRAGAVGLMQIMPATARGLGVDPTDPAQAVDGAARLVSRYLAGYDGDVSKVLAAYNAGPGAVSRYGGVPPYTETRTYVNRVTGYWEDLR